MTRRRMKTNTAPRPGIEAAVTVAAPKHFRALQWNEVVRRGDFIAAGQAGFALWEGPIGFRADAYVKDIYRQDAGPLARTGKPQ